MGIHEPAKSVLPTSVRGRGRGRGALRGAGKSMGPRAFKLDNRPTKFLVTNVTEETEPILKKHFSTFPGLVSFVRTEQEYENGDANTAVVQYHTRRHAEVAMNNPPKDVDMVELSWIEG